MIPAFEIVKDRVDIVDAAQRHGVQVVRGGKAHCPWYTDRTPSLSFYKDNSRFHCFSCGAGGDVIDLVGMLLNLTAMDAAKELRSCTNSRRAHLDGKFSASLCQKTLKYI